MNSIYNVFDTYEEADLAQKADFNRFRVDQNSEGDVEYWETTTQWSCIYERSDGKFVYPVYPNSMNKYIEEEKEGWWFKDEVV